MAVRRITLSLIAVVCFTLYLAAPAAAQFATSDLAGAWTIQGAETSSTASEPGGSVLGSIAFNAQGGVLAGTVVDNRNNQTQLSTGSLTVQSDGGVSGTVGDGQFTEITVRGRLLPGKQVIVAVTTAQFSDAPPTYTLVVLVKLDPERFQFSRSDVAGTWRTVSLLIPEIPEPRPETLVGSITFDTQGGISNGTMQSSNTSASYDVTGNLFVENIGVFSGAFSFNLGTDVDVSSYVGYMSPDKSLLAGIIARTRPELPLLQWGILVLQRQAAPAAPFAAADLTGSWDFLSLQAHTRRGNTGEWLAGNIQVNSAGLITGFLTGPGGENGVFVNLNDAESNRVTIDSDGTVIGNIVTELRVLDFRGTMNAAKDRIIGTDVLEADEDGNVDHLGAFALLKVNAVTPPPTSTVQFPTTATRVSEGGTATVIVQRSGAATTQVAVNYQVTGGTATLGSDYNVVVGNLTSPTGTLTFQSGETSKAINVVALTDSLVEGDETVILGLSSPTNGATLGTRSSTTVTIGDSAAVQFQQAAYTVKENVPSLVVTAIRTGSATTPFSVTYTAVPGTAARDVDFKLTPPGVLTFGAGVTSRTFSVAIVNNTLVDGNRSFTLVLGTPTSGVQLGSPASTTVTITDDDQPGIIRLDKTAYTVAESAGTLTIIVRRTGTNLPGNVNVNYACDALTATDEGSRPDYACPPGGTLTFKAGETMKTVSIPIFKDNVVDGPKTFDFRLFSPSNGAQLPAETATARVTITDVDLPGMIKFVPDKYSVNEGVASGVVKLTVVRTGGIGGGVLVDFTTVDGTAIGGREGQGDYEITSGTLSFGFGNTSATITIPIRQDTLAEGNETFTVVLSNARTATGPLPATTRPRPVVLPTPGSIATVTIVDDESAFQFSAPTFNAQEGTPTAVVTVLRTGTLTMPATVTFTATPGTAQPGQDFTPVAGTLTFPANTASKTFTVPIINNTRLDVSPRTVNLALGNPTGGAQLGTQSTAVLTIEDNEQAGTFKLDKAAYTVLESAGFLPVTVLRTGLNLTGNVSVTLVATDATAHNGTNYSLPPTALTFGPGETSKVVKVTILRDFVITGTTTFNLGLTEPSSGATVAAGGAATVNITEADAAGSVKFSAATYAVNESGGDAVVTLVRTGGAAGGVTVRVFTKDGTATVKGGDYSGIDQLVTFAAGNTSATVRIPIRPDTVSEDDKSFQVKLALPDPNPNPSGVIIAAPSTATVTIMDDDDSTVQFNGSFIGNFPVVERDGNLKRVVVVDFDSIDGTATGGVDYSPTRGSITFAANTKLATIPLVIANDTIAEGNETFTYRLLNPRGARLGEESQKTFIITDNDFGGSNIQFTAPTFTGKEGQTVTLTVARTGGLGASLVVNWTAGEGTATPGVDFTPASGSFTFATNSLTASFTIKLLNDGFIEGTETVPITLSVPNDAATLGPQSTTILQIEDVAPPASAVQFTAPTF